jgi:hypothetical protein
MKKDIKALLDTYTKELNETVQGMENIKKEIARLNVAGVELTAKANVLAGKVEALKELEGN